MADGSLKILLLLKSSFLTESFYPIQRWKWRGAQGKEGPETDPKRDPAQGESPRPDTTTEAMEYSSTHKKRPNMTKLWNTQQEAERVRVR